MMLGDPDFTEEPQDSRWPTKKEDFQQFQIPNRVWAQGRFDMVHMEHEVLRWLHREFNGRSPEVMDVECVTLTVPERVRDGGRVFYRHFIKVSVAVPWPLRPAPWYQKLLNLFQQQPEPIVHSEETREVQYYSLSKIQFAIFKKNFPLF